MSAKDELLPGRDRPGGQRHPDLQPDQERRPHRHACWPASSTSWAATAAGPTTTTTTSPRSTSNRRRARASRSPTPSTAIPSTATTSRTGRRRGGSTPSTGTTTPRSGYHYHATKTYPYLNGGFHGEVTERGGQVDPQPHAEPVREALAAAPRGEDHRLHAVRSPAATASPTRFAVRRTSSTTRSTRTGGGVPVRGQRRARPRPRPTRNASVARVAAPGGDRGRGRDAAAAQAPRTGRRPARGTAVVRPPVISALDLDGDRELSADEIARAPQSLLTLDLNKDGSVTNDEMRPPRPPGDDNPPQKKARPRQGGGDNPPQKKARPGKARRPRSAAATAPRGRRNRPEQRRRLLGPGDCSVLRVVAEARSRQGRQALRRGAPSAAPPTSPRPARDAAAPQARSPPRLAKPTERLNPRISVPWW